MSEQTASTAMQRGTALLDLRRFGEAADHFRAAIAAAPDWPAPRCNLALALLGAGDPEAALEAAERAAEVDPEDEATHRIRAMALLALGRADEALEAAETAAGLAPESALVHEMLASVKLEVGDRFGARSAATRALERDPGRPSAHNVLGDVELESERFHAAERSYRAALALDAEDVHALNNLGVALDRQGRGDEAREVLELAARADPRVDLPRDNLANASWAHVTDPAALESLRRRSSIAVYVVAVIVYFAVSSVGLGHLIGLACAAAVAVLAVLGSIALQWRRRQAALSPGARRLLADQRWSEKLALPLPWRRR